MQRAIKIRLLRLAGVDSPDADSNARLTRGIRRWKGGRGAEIGINLRSFSLFAVIAGLDAEGGAPKY
jgi:hypothetical protein